MVSNDYLKTARNAQGLMNVSYAVSAVKEFLQQHEQEVLPIRIAYLLDKQKAGTKLTKKERALMGVCYPVYLLEDAGSMDDAITLAVGLRKKFNINIDKVKDELKKKGK